MRKLYIEPASACNLNCTMCFRHQWFDEKIGLMDETVCAAVRQAVTIPSAETVFFGGMGEPLLHPALPALVRAAADAGKFVELITNGTLLTPQLASQLADNGLGRIWLSMDGFSRTSYESIRRGGMFDTICRNLTALNALPNRPQLGLTFVMMRENLHELDAINAFADHVRADVLNLSHVLPGTPLPESDALYSAALPVGKMRRFAAPGSPPPGDRCPFIDDGACFVRWDGEVCPCMQLLHNSYTYLYEERRRVAMHSFGNIRTAPLQAIWDSPEYASFRQRVTDFAFPCCTICMGCEDRKENRTDCMYNVAPTCGACLWARGWIRCP